MIARLALQAHAPVEASLCGVATDVAAVLFGWQPPLYAVTLLIKNCHTRLESNQMADWRLEFWVGGF